MVRRRDERERGEEREEERVDERKEEKGVNEGKEGMSVYGRHV